MQVSDFLADFLATKAKVLGHIALAHSEVKAVNAVRLVNRELLLNNKYLISTHQALHAPLSLIDHSDPPGRVSKRVGSANVYGSAHESPYDAIDQALLGSGVSGELQDELLCSPFYRLIIESETHSLDSRFDSTAVIELACEFGKQWSTRIQDAVRSGLANPLSSTKATANWVDNSVERTTETQAIGFYWLRFRVETLRRSGHSPLVMVNRAGTDFSMTPDH